MESLPQIPLSGDELDQLVNDWLDEGLLKARSQKKFTKEERQDPSFCFLHESKSHGLRDCHRVKRMFYKQMEEGRVVMSGERGRTDVHRRPLPRHDVHAILSGESQVKEPPLMGNEEKESVVEVETQEDILVKGLMKARGLSLALSQLGLDEEGRKEATKVLIEIVRKRGEGCSLIGAPITRMAEAHVNVVTFKEDSRTRNQPYHNKPLFVEAALEGRKVKRALIDSGSGVNVLPLGVMEALGIPAGRMKSSKMLLSTFQGKPVKTVGIVRVNLQVGPIKTMNDFHVVEGFPTYHILLGRP